MFFGQCLNFGAAGWINELRRNPGSILYLDSVQIEEFGLFCWILSYVTHHSWNPDLLKVMQLTSPFLSYHETTRTFPCNAVMLHLLRTWRSEAQSGTDARHTSGFISFLLFFLLSNNFFKDATSNRGRTQLRTYNQRARAFPQCAGGNVSVPRSAMLEELQ